MVPGWTRSDWRHEDERRYEAVPIPRQPDREGTTSALVVLAVMPA